MTLPDTSFGTLNTATTPMALPLFGDVAQKKGTIFYCGWEGHFRKWQGGRNNCLRFRVLGDGQRACGTEAVSRGILAGDVGWLQRQGDKKLGSKVLDLIFPRSEALDQ